MASVGFELFTLFFFRSIDFFLFGGIMAEVGGSGKIGNSVNSRSDKVNDFEEEESNPM